MNKIYVGVDNGVTGSVCILSSKGFCFHFQTPVKKELSYTKKKQFLNRIDFWKMSEAILEYVSRKNVNAICVIERPMVNPGRWKASMSAIRALEATLVVLEYINMPYRYIDSKEWQRALLPKGLAKEELKKAAIDVAKRLFPKIQTKDADSILIAEYARRMNF